MALVGLVGGRTFVKIQWETVQKITNPK